MQNRCVLAPHSIHEPTLLVSKLSTCAPFPRSIFRPSTVFMKFNFVLLFEVAVSLSKITFGAAQSAATSRITAITTGVTTGGTPTIQELNNKLVNLNPPLRISLAIESQKLASLFNALRSCSKQIMEPGIFKCASIAKRRLSR